MGIFDRFKKPKSNFEQIDKDDGFYIKVFFLDSTKNMNGWIVAEDAILPCLQRALQKRYHGKSAPLIEMPDYAQPQFRGHPAPWDWNMISSQEQYRVGDFVDVGITNGVGWCIIKITNEKVIDDIKNGRTMFVSPSIHPNRPTVDGVDIDFDTNHLAIVDNPAYGNKAHITGTCTGSGDNCRIHLAKHACTMKNQVLLRANEILLKEKKEEKGMWVIIDGQYVFIPRR